MLRRQLAETVVIPVLFHRFWSPCLAQDPQIPSEAQFHSILLKLLKKEHISTIFWFLRGICDFRAFALPAEQKHQYFLRNINLFESALFIKNKEVSEFIGIST